MYLHVIYVESHFFLYFSKSQTFRSFEVIINIRRPMAFFSLSLHDAPGLAPAIDVSFWWQGDFPVRFSNRDTSWNAWNRHSVSCMVDMGILFKAILNIPVTNIKWQSHPWEVTVSFRPIKLSTNFVTLIPSLTFTELRLVYMELLQRVWHTSRERLPFGTPGLGLAYAAICETNFPELVVCFHDFSPWILLGTFSILLYWKYLQKCNCIIIKMTSVFAEILLCIKYTKVLAEM